MAPSIGPKAQPIRNADANLGLVDLIGLLDRVDDAIGELFDDLVALRIDHDDRELVAAHAPDMAIGADFVDQPLGDRAEDRVALGMAEGVVDRFEPIEVEEHDRAGHIAAGRRAQGLAEQLAHPAAVGQARKHVDIGQMGQALLGLADLGDVRADPAEALEATGSVDDRVAGNRDPASPARGLQFHLERIERLFFEQDAAELRVTAEQGGKRMADELRGRLAEQRAHPRADVGDPVLAIDLPQPADAALLVFLEQQAGALALAADVGVGLELGERPARNGEDAENRDAEVEDDREHVLERNAVAGENQRSAHAQGKADHPGGRTRRDYDQAERADAKARHDRGGDDLSARIEGRKQIERKAQPDRRTKRDLTDHHRHRHPPAGTADAGDRLVAGEPHCREIDAADRKCPGNQQRRRRHVPQVRGQHQRSHDVGGREEWRELSARNQLHVAQRRTFGFDPASRETSRFTTGKLGRNQALITIWCFVHPPAVPPVRIR